MERERKEKAKKRNAATPARVPLMELEGSERNERGKKGKEKKGKAKTSPLLEPARKDESNDKAKKGKRKNGAAQKMKALLEITNKEIAERRKSGEENVVDLPACTACLICLSRDHWTISCPNNVILQPNAFIGPHAEIVCLCCGEVMPHWGQPGVDWPARAIRGPIPGGVYPSFEQQRKELKNSQIVCLCCDKEKAHPGEPGVDWPARAILPGAEYPRIVQRMKGLHMRSADGPKHQRKPIGEQNTSAAYGTGTGTGKASGGKA